MVQIGKWTVVVSMVVAGLVAPSLRTLDQAYQFIQEYVGFISPGVLAVFLLGLFWKRTTTTAALIGTLLTIPLSAILKFLPRWTNGSFPDYPFLDRMTITFTVIVVAMVLVSILRPQEHSKEREILIDMKMFKVSGEFMVGSILIIGILTALYISFW
jgi:SSS family solute:Na+ symporter